MIDQRIADIQACASLDALKAEMQAIAGAYGFASYNFIDAGNLQDEVPYYLTTVNATWEATYRDNDFVHADPYVAKARRTNLPFTWASIPGAVNGRGGRKRAAARLMDAARDFRLREGFLVPYHFRDEDGRYGAALMVYLWEDPAAQMAFMLSERRHELHVITLYWAQRVIEIVAQEFRHKGSPFRRQEMVTSRVTDREREVLKWAAAGKTVLETADILGLTENTIEGYFKTAFQKLGVVNRTHAVAVAIRNGIIDI